ncbi:MAG: 2-amino-4-hydroxy-6-hydroxymethyldihydropteridine diphosphokinase [Muribaculaceae bacterium]|nr:2-amino-4-hydroxy-6-hydroxymethyldihydropteridine diphosphokinase [Muribaculaceae bacterium]
MKYVISLGSNCGFREQHLLHALNSLAEISDSIYSSTHYESPALGGSAPHYLNAVAEIETPIPLDDLNRYLKQLEVAEGRDSEARAEGRVPLDADVVVVDDEVIRPKDYSQFFFKRGFEELRSDFLH